MRRLDIIRCGIVLAASLAHAYPAIDVTLDVARTGVDQQALSASNTQVIRRPRHQVPYNSQVPSTAVNSSSDAQHVPVASAFATLLGLALACVVQPYGSLLLAAGGGHFWRLSPIAGLLEALYICIGLIKGACIGLSFRQTCLAILSARTESEAERRCAHERPGSLGRARIGTIISVVPVLFLFLRVCATRGNVASVVIGVAYFISWLSVSLLVLVDEICWSKYNEAVRVAAIDYSPSFAVWMRIGRWRLVPTGLHEHTFALCHYRRERDVFISIGPLGILLFPLFCYCLVVFVLVCFGPHLFLSLYCVKILWLPAGIGAGVLLLLSFRILYTFIGYILASCFFVISELSLIPNIISIATVIGGAMLFVQSYDESHTTRPRWFEWLGR